MNRSLEVGTETRQLTERAKTDATYRMRSCSARAGGEKREKGEVLSSQKTGSTTPAKVSVCPKIEAGALQTQQMHHGLHHRLSLWVTLRQLRNTTGRVLGSQHRPVTICTPLTAKRVL